MSLHEYLRLLRRRWRLIVLGVLVGVAAAIALTASATKVYTAKTQFFVAAQEGDATNLSNAYTGGLFTQQRVKSYVSVIQSIRIAQLVRDDLRIDDSPKSLSRHVLASAPLDTVLINVSVENPDPQKAQAIANSIGRQFPRIVDQIERPSDGGTSPVRVSVVQEAPLPDQPTSPRPILNLTLGFLLGLIAGVVGAFARETLDTSVIDPEQARDLVGAPILGAISFDPDGARKPLVVVSAPSSPRAESFRQLRTNLQFVDIEHPLRSVVITSSVPGEGKSTTACNLAITLADAGLSVILVEGDLRRPRIADYMGVDGAVGLTSVLLGRTVLGDALQHWGSSGLRILPSGPMPPNPSELLGSQGMQDLLHEMEDAVDIVLIDAPPLLPVTDAAVLGTLTSGLVMLVRSNSTDREQLTRAVETVRGVGGTVLGAVMNMVPARSGASYSYGYAYGYASRPSPNAAVQAGTTAHSQGAAGRAPTEDVLPHLGTSRPPAPSAPSPEWRVAADEAAAGSETFGSASLAPRPMTEIRSHLRPQETEL